MKPLIIIGTGLAGYNLAKEFRKIDPTTPLILITQDNGHFYSKPQLSTALANGKTPQQLIITDVKTMALQLNAQILTYTQVKAIDSTSQEIIIKNKAGEKILAYRDLVLATGANPKPFSLNNLDNPFRINSLEDYEFFITNSENMTCLAIIGSGLVGCEFAHDLIHKIKNVHVITPDPYPLYRLVPACMGEALQHHLENLGICFHTATLCNGVLPPLTLSLTHGKEIQTDGILTAIGIHPNITLAKTAPIQTKEGIVVDDFLQTNQPHIFALGDCAQIQGFTRQFVAPLLQSARALAQTLCAKPTPIVFTYSPIVLKVSTYPVIVHPPRATEGQWHYEIHPDGIKALFTDSHQLLGYALSGSQVVHRQACLKAITEEAALS